MSAGSVWLMDDGLTTLPMPSIFITTPTSEPTWDMAAGTVTLGGNAGDPGGVPLQISWSSDRGGSGAIAGSTTWQIPNVPVLPGVNTIAVTVVGSTGRTATDVISVITPGTPAERAYFLAEWATGSFFETFILIANPNNVEVPVTLTFLPSGGAPVIRGVTVPANGRSTINIEALDPVAPELATGAVATQVLASMPVVVERAQYWPRAPESWYEAHNSFGVTAPGRRWGLAEGRVGNPAEFPPAAYQSFVLLANPGASQANVTVTFLRQNGTTVQKAFVVAPQSRYTVQIAGPGSDVPDLVDETFGAIIDSDQPIAVERAMYASPGGQVFGSGTNATATPLP